MEEKKMPDPAPSAITDKTTIPLKMLFVLVPTLFGAVGSLVTVVTWATQVEAKAVTANHRLDSVEAGLKAVIRIDRRLSRIEGKLGIEDPAGYRRPEED